MAGFHSRSVSGWPYSELDWMRAVHSLADQLVSGDLKKDYSDEILSEVISHIDKHADRSQDLTEHYVRHAITRACFKFRKKYKRNALVLKQIEEQEKLKFGADGSSATSPKSDPSALAMHSEQHELDAEILAAFLHEKPPPGLSEKKRELFFRDRRSLKLRIDGKSYRQIQRLLRLSSPNLAYMSVKRASDKVTAIARKLEEEK